MIWSKGAYQSAKFQTFNVPRKISPHLYVDRLLKVYKVLVKKYRGVIFRYIEELVMQNLKKNWLAVWKMT